MAMISGDLRVSATLASSYSTHPFGRSLAPSKSALKAMYFSHGILSYKPYAVHGSFSYTNAYKVSFNGFHGGGSSISEVAPKFPNIELIEHNVRGHCQRAFRMTRDNIMTSPKPMNQEIEGFLHNAINMSFFDRLNLAWKIIFPSPATRKSSNANIAKQRLKMILFSDRCAVSDEAKRKIVSNIVGALSDFVEIDSQDKVQLSVSTDPDVGTIYSVTVPVRRVKSEYQEDDDEYGAITNIEYKDKGDFSGGSVDVKFDFFLPDDKMQ
ncbi:hypothetical protein GIB67_039337 [Kingdonia uniflora]|uniref:Uncharacterized protein n=1 Tax=Kingdonia uniflora TaxID=39325 RepID=A0A7J7LX81_9MAGN|nr:hypothetical protein GIB67_039337 [Kingdonia uniflora]